MFVLKLLISTGLCVLYFNFVHSQRLGIGGQCWEPEECGMKHFECVNGICQCDKDHIPDKNNKWCVVEIEANCVTSSDTCYDGNATCVGTWQNYKCQCKEGFVLHPKKRVCSVAIGNNCTVADECIEGICNDEKCTCVSPLEPNTGGSKCLPGLHDDCQNFKQCAQDHAICNYQTLKCECEENYKEVSRNESTLCLSKLDFYCENATDCADIGANCTLTNICECGNGYVRNPKISECLEVATELNSPCKEDIQCTSYSGIGTECKANKCVCRKGFYFDEDFSRCVRSCLCDNVMEEVQKLKNVMKSLKPAVKLLFEKHEVNDSFILSQLDYL